MKTSILHRSTRTLALPRFDYTVKLDLLAPSIYIIGVSPRTARGDVLVNEIEGEHWTNFCRFDRSLLAPRKRRRRLVVPGPRSPRRRLTRLPLRITITSSFASAQRGGMRGSSCSSTVRVRPKRRPRYTFKVSGCDENSIRGVKNCSDFTEPVVVQAARNTNSLRRFLAGADASSGIRRSMIAPPPLPPERFGLSCANNRLQWF
jgi:hypothetical protein